MACSSKVTIASRSKLQATPHTHDREVIEVDSVLTFNQLRKKEVHTHWSGQCAHIQPTAYENKCIYTPRVNQPKDCLRDSGYLTELAKCIAQHANQQYSALRPCVSLVVHTMCARKNSRCWGSTLLALPVLTPLEDCNVQHKKTGRKTKLLGQDDLFVTNLPITILPPCFRCGSLESRADQNVNGFCDAPRLKQTCSTLKFNWCKL